MELIRKWLLPIETLREQIKSRVMNNYVVEERDQSTRLNLLIDSLRERSESKHLEKEELGDGTELKLKAKINLWYFRNKSLAKKTETEGLSSFQSSE